MEYICLNCGKFFDSDDAEYDVDDELICPACGSDEIELD